MSPPANLVLVTVALVRGRGKRVCELHPPLERALGADGGLHASVPAGAAAHTESRPGDTSPRGGRRGVYPAGSPPAAGGGRPQKPMVGVVVEWKNRS